MVKFPFILISKHWKMLVCRHTNMEEYTVMASGLFFQPVEPLGSFKVRKENPRGKILQPCQYDLNCLYCWATSQRTIFSSPPSRQQRPGTEQRRSSTEFPFFSDILKEGRLFSVHTIFLECSYLKIDSISGTESQPRPRPKYPQK